jgi:hypothetical protein
MSLPPNIPRKKAKEAGEKFFMPDKPCKHGHVSLKWTSNNECIECIAVRTSTLEFKQKSRVRLAVYQNKHREKYRLRSKQWQQENKDLANQKLKEWRKNNPEKAKAISDKQRKIRYSQILVLNANRRAMKINATPNWLTAVHKAQIQEMYDVAIAKTMQLGIKHDVDHIVPLLHNSVSGLHVPWNLQVLTASENRQKSNHFKG